MYTIDGRDKYGILAQYKTENENEAHALYDSLDTGELRKNGKLLKKKNDHQTSNDALIYKLTQ